MLCPVGWSTASLAPALWRPVVPPRFHLRQRSLQPSPNISWRQNCPWLRTTALQVCILIIISMFGQEERENDNSAITAKKCNQVHFSTETWSPSRDYGPGPGAHQKHLPHPLPPTPPQGFGGRPTALHNTPSQVNYTEVLFSCCYLFKTLGFQKV